MLEGTARHETGIDLSHQVFRLDGRMQAASAFIALIWMGLLMVLGFRAPLWTLVPLALLVETVYVASYRNTHLILDAFGVKHIDGWGKVTFARHWSEIERLDYSTPTTRGTRQSLLLRSGSQSCDLSQFKGVAEIAQIVRERAPHAVVAPSLLHLPPIQQGKTK